MLKGFRAAERISRGFEVVDVHWTARRDDFTGVNPVPPRIAGDRHQSRDRMTAVSDLDRFPAATFLRYLLACCRSSRTPIVFMCYVVAHTEGGPAARHGSPYRHSGADDVVA